MVYEQFDERQGHDHYEIGSADNISLAPCTYGTTSCNSLSAINRLHHFEGPPRHPGHGQRRSSMASIQVPAYERQPPFMQQQQEGGDGGDWTTIAEATMPLKTSEFLKAASRRNGGGPGRGGDADVTALFQASLECRSREISRKLVWINLISLIVNLILAIVAFYFSFVNNSSSTSAFAADCVLDFISSAIVLWRYYGDLNSVYMEAREQIACIYLGALFEISAFGIIIKATSDIVSEASPEEGAAGYDLIYLAVAATLACTTLTIFKCSLYRTVRDKSILLDVINTLISTVFALSIIMSQLLINVDASFWYMDPILSIVLAILMAAFGIKVISQNVNILCPGSMGAACSMWPRCFKSGDKYKKRTYSTPLTFTTKPTNNNTNQGGNNFEPNLQLSIEQGRATNWQKSDYSSIAFV